MHGPGVLSFLVYPVKVSPCRQLQSTSEVSVKEQQQRKLESIQGSEQRDPQYQYSVYVLEANLSFQNGMAIPLMSEFLDYQHGDTERRKQDCETKAFHRLAGRYRWGIDSCILVEKHQGYAYEHAFAKDWHATPSSLSAGYVPTS